LWFGILRRIIKRKPHIQTKAPVSFDPALSLLKKARLLCRQRRNGRSRTSVYVPARLQLGFAHPDLFEQAVLDFLQRFVNDLSVGSV